MCEYTSCTKLSRETFNRILDMGCLVVSGFVRDVIILGQDKFKDIDIICDISKKDELVKIIGGVVVFSRPAVHGEYYTTCLRVMTIISGGVHYDIRFFNSVQDWKDEKSCEFTSSLFYLAKDHLGVQYLPPGESLPSLLNLVRNRHIKVLYKGDNKANLLGIRLRTIEFKKRGWKIIYPKLI